MVDTLKYTKDLQKAGLTQEQAENFAKASLNLFTESTATKEDLRALQHSLMREIESKMASKEQMDEKLSAQESRIINRMGGIIVSSFILFGIASKYFGL